MWSRRGRVNEKNGVDHNTETADAEALELRMLTEAKRRPDWP